MLIHLLINRLINKWNLLKKNVTKVFSRRQRHCARYLSRLTGFTQWGKITTGKQEW